MSVSARGYSARKGYESIPRTLLQPDAGRMSARALGVLCHLLSQPDGWRSSADRLSRTFKEGRDAILTALAELESLGYLARREVQQERGHWGWVWIYGDDPYYVAAHLGEVLGALSREGHGIKSLTRLDRANALVTPGPGKPNSAEPDSDNQGP